MPGGYPIFPFEPRRSRYPLGMNNLIGVCSWSLEPSGPEELAERVRSLGLSTVQLALDPLRRGEWPVERTLPVLQEAGIEVHSGMMGTRGEDYSTLETIRVTGGVVPDEHWDENLHTTEDNARLAADLGLVRPGHQHRQVVGV